jgi:hypothetical protein
LVTDYNPLVDQATLLKSLLEAELTKQEAFQDAQKLATSVHQDISFA